MTAGAAEVEGAAAWSDAWERIDGAVAASKKMRAVRRIREPVGRDPGGRGPDGRWVLLALRMFRMLTHKRIQSAPVLFLNVTKT
jgi:hypothetical protein